jgi:hypothetical protein
MVGLLNGLAVAATTQIYFSFLGIARLLVGMP